MATPTGSTHALAIPARPYGEAVSEGEGGDYPTLNSNRFRFRPFSLKDIEPLASLANEHRIADTTIGIPHPYTKEFARLWIGSHASHWRTRFALHWAAIERGETVLAGYAGLVNIDLPRRQAELCFWVGSGVQRHKDAVEWSEAVLRFALSELKMRRVYALQLRRHPLAARVLKSIGMRPEGVVRKRVFSGGPMEDVDCWAIAPERQD